MHECCASCEYCLHIPGDEGDEWYCRREHMGYIILEAKIDDAYFDKCDIYKRKREDER